MKLFLLFTVFIPVLAFAQVQTEMPREWRDDASALSVFSENGDMFFLVLNGINQNDMPTSRLRVEGLPQYNNDIEIVFADKRTPAIRRRLNIVDPVDGKAVNMVLKVVRDRNGYARLKFHKCEEIERDYKPQQGEYVMGYNDYRQTFLTGKNSGEFRAKAVAGMDAQTFADLKKAINAASFDESKLSTAKTALASNQINTNQVMEICKLLAYDDSRLDFAKYAYSKAVDQNNYFKVGSVFSFSDTKESLNQFISAGGK